MNEIAPYCPFCGKKDFSAEWEDLGGQETHVSCCNCGRSLLIKRDAATLAPIQLLTVEQQIIREMNKPELILPEAPWKLSHEDLQAVRNRDLISLEVGRIAENGDLSVRVGIAGYWFTLIEKLDPEFSSERFMDAIAQNRDYLICLIMEAARNHWVKECPKAFCAALNATRRLTDKDGDGDKTEARSKLLAELERRIGNVQKVEAWQRQEAELVLDCFKTAVAELTLEDLAARSYVPRAEDADRACRKWQTVEAELRALQAMKDDIIAGRVM